jgi:hypothetical protein
MYRQALFLPRVFHRAAPAGLSAPFFIIIPPSRYSRFRDVFLNNTPGFVFPFPPLSQGRDFFCTRALSEASNSPIPSHRIPPTPLENGGKELFAPLFKGGRGDSNPSYPKPPSYLIPPSKKFSSSPSPLCASVSRASRPLGGLWLALINHRTVFSSPCPPCLRGEKVVSC